MKFKEFELKEGNHFVAIEYYGLILNRTFLILLTRDYLIGLKVNGVVSVQGGSDPLTQAVTNSMAITDDLQNPYSYIKGNFLGKLENQNILSDEILKVSCSNFKIDRSKIIDVSHNKKKKWGMGPYPHDGKVYVKTSDNKIREFIIIGIQSGEKIANWIKK